MIDSKWRFGCMKHFSYSKRSCGCRCDVYLREPVSCFIGQAPTVTETTLFLDHFLLFVGRFTDRVSAILLEKWIVTPRKWPYECEDHWTDLSPSDQCPISSLLMDHWASCGRALDTVLNWSKWHSPVMAREKQLFGSLIFLFWWFDTANCLLVLSGWHL